MLNNLYVIVSYDQFKGKLIKAVSGDGCCLWAEFSPQAF